MADAGPAPRPEPSGAAAVLAAGRIGWAAMSLVLLLPALAVLAQPGAEAVLAWQPQRVLSEPWRAWSAAWVHLSRLHLIANLAGGLLVAALGLVAAVPMRAAAAWALAWPLTHAGLWLMPQLQRYGGLSGVLHAGVAVVVVVLLRRSARGERRLGWAIAAVLGFKLISEAPWRGPLAYPAGWDIATAPIAHATGVAAGALMAWLLLPRRQPQR